MRINYKNINTNKLHDELINAGVIPILVESINSDTWITFKDDEDMSMVDAIVLAHNPAPINPISQKEIAIQEIESATTVSALKTAMLKFVEAS